MKFTRKIWIDSLVLGTICIIIYIANGIFTNPSGDTVPTSVLPFSMLLQHNFYVGRYVISHNQAIPYYVRAFHNHFISGSPVGAAITAIPFYAVFLIFGGHANAITGAALGKISAAIISSVSVVMLYWIMTKLNIKRTIKLIFSFLYGLGSETLSISSQGLWQHGPAQLWIIGFLYFVVMIYDKERSRAWMFVGAGISIGMLLLSRPVDLILIFPFLISLRHSHIRSKIWITIAMILPFIIFNMAYDRLFFGHFFSTGYGSSSKEISMFSFPIIPGILGNLFSPSKGLFVFMPWALISFLWVIKFRSEKLTISIYYPLLLSCFPYIFIYSLFYQWPAGYSYGPRYMTDLLPILALLGSGYIDSYWSSSKFLRKQIYKSIFIILFAWSVSIQLLGTYVQNGSSWNVAARPNTFMKPLWSIRGSQPIYYLNTLKALIFQPTILINPKASYSSIRLLNKPYIFKKGTNPIYFQPNTIYHGTVIIHNEGSQGWSAYPNREGLDAVHFSYTVWKNGKQINSIPSLRTALLHSVQSGKSIKVYFQFITPNRYGAYKYVFTLLQEGVMWFQGGIATKNAFIRTIVVM